MRLVERTKWEYHVLMSDLIDQRATADAFAEVRRLGENGWELVSVDYLTAYAPSLEPPRIDDDVMARVRKRLNGAFGRMAYSSASKEEWAKGRAEAEVEVETEAEAHAPPQRIDALPETRLEAWFKRPA